MLQWAQIAGEVKTTIPSFPRISQTGVGYIFKGEETMAFTTWKTKFASLKLAIITADHIIYCRRESDSQLQSLRTTKVVLHSLMGL